jgi:hypothetical protein
MFMKIYTYSALAIAACALAVPLASAQTNTGKSQTEQTTAKQAENSKPDSYAAQGAQKQRTQGLPSTFAPNTGAAWNSNTQPSKSQ